MRINQELGREIVKRLAEYIDVDINIMDLDGRIVASTDSARVNERHSGAIQVIETGEPLILNQETHHQYIGTKPGVNLPIIHQGNITGVVGVSGSPDAILRITGLIRVSVEIVLEQIYIKQQSFYRERQWANWFHQLMEPAGYDETKLREEAQYWLKNSIDTKWRVLVLTNVNAQNIFEEIQLELADTRLQLLFALPFADEEIIIVTSSPLGQVKNWAEQLNLQEGRLGVGEEGVGLAGIRKSYKQAKQALEFNKEQERITYSSDWYLKRLAVALPDEEFNNICAVYEERLNSLDPLYIQTLTCYFAMDFSVKETADALHIHRNTLQYRLEQVKEKVGLRPRIFYDAYILQLILNRML
ncbi:CdaR family transcriptional regulator [Planococcus lenghuensis]|nr:sugar diacid recognition domain-containing protein [Planococcus lenghuensis]